MVKMCSKQIRQDAFVYSYFSLCTAAQYAHMCVRVYFLRAPNCRYCICRCAHLSASCMCVMVYVYYVHVLCT